MAERQVVIVTGASSGIGRELVRAATRKAYAVIGLARRRERLDALAAEIAREGGTFVPVVADVTAADAPARIVQTATTRFGRIDVLVHNAGSATAGPLLAQSDRDIAAQWELHVGAPLRITREALGALRQSHGQVIFIGSGVARVPAPNFGAYCAAKAAMRATAMQLRREYGSEIAFTYVDPGTVDTEFSQSSGMERTTPRWMSANPARIAARVLKAMQTRPARLNAVPWQGAAVAIGAAFPALADRMIHRMADHPARASVSATAAPPPEPTPAPQPGPPPATDSNFQRALLPVARRMERVKLPASFLAQLLKPGAQIELGDAAMRWAGMPNKNEREALAEVLRALEAGGFVQRTGQETWVVLSAAD